MILYNSSVVLANEVALFLSISFVVETPKYTPKAILHCMLKLHHYRRITYIEDFAFFTLPI